MSDSSVVLGLLCLYLVFLGMMSLRLKKSAAEVGHSQRYLFGGGFGFALSFFAIAASLFSTFTLQGMPAFFRNHGIASWVFLGITDVCLAAVLLICGMRLRSFVSCLARQSNTVIHNLTELFKNSSLPSWTAWFFVLSATLFMIPYITIQIKGAALLLQMAIPVGETHLLWSIAIVCIMIAYSWSGGLRAIFVTDVVQGVILFITVWAIAFCALQASGGIGELFASVKDIEAELLSAPGPKALLSWQFLLVSFISIVLMPYVQPHMATRVLVARDTKSFVRATMALAVFSVLVILPTLVLGFRSLVVGQSVPEGQELLQMIVRDAPTLLYALFIVGVLAAAMSTADSQLFALGTEWRSLMMRDNIIDSAHSTLWVKGVSVVVALLALYFAQSSFTSLVLFALNSFIGTSLLLPLVIAAMVSRSEHRILLVVSSVCSVLAFICMICGVLPRSFLGLRFELWLYAFNALVIVAPIITTTIQKRSMAL